MERKILISQITHALKKGDLEKLNSLRIKLLNKEENICKIIDKMKLKEQGKIEIKDLIKTDTIKLFLNSLISGEKDKLNQAKEWAKILGFGAFEELLRNMTSLELFSEFIIRMPEFIKRDTEYEKITEEILFIIKEIDPKKIIITWVIKTLQKSFFQEGQVDSLIAILDKNNLIDDFTVILLKSLFELRRGKDTKGAGYKVIRQYAKLLERIYDLCPKKVHISILISYISGLFDFSTELAELKQRVQQNIDKDYYELIDLSRDNIKQAGSSLEKMGNELEEQFLNRKQEIELYWNNEINNEKIKFVKSLIKIYEMLVQSREDMKTLKISIDSDLHKRIFMNTKFIEKEIENLGIEIVGKIGEIVEFNDELHQAINNVLQDNKVEILVPAFRFKTGEILKKSIVKSVGGGK